MAAPQRANSESSSVLNTLINQVPFEMPVPRYQFLGFCTHLEERLTLSETDRNSLDRAYFEHDIAYLYTNNSSNSGDNGADHRLAECAFSRMLSESSGSEERSVALLTVLCMSGKITANKADYKTYKEKVVEVSQRRQSTIGHTIDHATMIAVKLIADDLLNNYALYTRQILRDARSVANVMITMNRPRHRNLVAIGLGIVDLMLSFAVGPDYALSDLQRAQALVSSGRYHRYDGMMLIVTR
ncbi:hypothetical protein TSAR_001710, partial [Trichomalopsis sarcophagae]